MILKKLLDWDFSDPTQRTERYSWLEQTSQNSQRYVIHVNIWNFLLSSISSIIICRGASVLMCGFSKTALQLYWNLIGILLFFYKLLYIFGFAFHNNTSGRLLLELLFIFLDNSCKFMILNFIISVCNKILFWESQVLSWRKFNW